MSDNIEYKILNSTVVDVEELVNEMVEIKFQQLAKDLNESIEKHNKMNMDKIKQETMTTLERDAMWERHAHLVEAYMDNMNKILEKRL